MFGSTPVALVILRLAAASQSAPAGLTRDRLFATIAAEDGFYDDALPQDLSDGGEAVTLSLMQKEGVYLYRKTEAPAAADVPLCQRPKVQCYGEDEVSSPKPWEDDDSLAFVQTGAQVFRSRPADAVRSSFAVDADGEVTSASALSVSTPTVASGMTAVVVSAGGNTMEL